MYNDIRRSVFQVEVFSEGPLKLSDNDNDPFSLAEINYLITEGDCIGMVETILVDEVVPQEKVESELLRIGNDGEFFESYEEDELPIPEPA